MNVNWMALYVSIVTEQSVDEALRNMGINLRSREHQPIKKEFDPATKEIFELFSKGCSYVELAEKFNITSNAVRNRVMRYNKALKLAR